MIRWSVLAKPALLLAGLAAAGEALRYGLGQQAMASPGQLGLPGFLLAATVACAIGVPRQVVAYAAGLGFGFWGGCALAMAAEVAGCAIDFVWVRLVARDWAAKRLRGRLARLDGALARNPFSATLVLRLLPIGSNIALNLLAGISGVAVAPFLAASALGYLPQTIVFALLGTGIGVGQGTRVALAVLLFGVASALGLVLMRRWRRSGGAGLPDQ